MMPVALLVPGDLVLIDDAEELIEATEVVPGRPVRMRLCLGGGRSTIRPAAERLDVVRHAPHTRSANTGKARVVGPPTPPAPPQPPEGWVQKRECGCKPGIYCVQCGSGWVTGWRSGFTGVHYHSCHGCGYDDVRTYIA